MPVENVGQPVVLKTNKEAGKALVKSKDGRVKWLTVSADPSSPSWEERVRSWASKLGVCAQPSPNTPATPLATPPPDDPGAQEQHWPSGETGDNPTAAEPDAHAVVPALKTESSKQQKQQQPTAERKIATKEAAQPNRAGSFARGFLLGLGGVGVDSSSSRSESPSKVEVDGQARDTVASPCSTLPGVQPCNPEMEVHAKGVESVALEVADGTSGRERWVKGFNGALSSPTNSSTDGDNVSGYDSIDASKSSSDGRRTRSASLSESDKRIGDGDTPTAAEISPADSRDTRAGDQSAAAWLETVHEKNNLNRNISVDSSGGGMAATKAAGKKKKSKGSKAKGKGGKAKANKASVSKANVTKSPTDDASTLGSTKRARKGKDKSALNVTFGEVTLLEFTRDVGGCAVPSDGTWALSLGLPFRETRVDVDGYEASKAEILAERTLKLSKKQRHLATGETRQFDHRPVGERNPLFDRLEEKERSKRLLDYACFHKSDLEEAYRDNHHSNHKSIYHIDDHGDSRDLGVFFQKVSHSDFVDKSQEAATELVALRKSRRSSQGCSCACFRADKLNVAKLRGELSKRALKASGSKKELTKMLQDAMRQEDEEQGGEGHKVCRSDDCQCVVDGVECHADLCNCCKGPNIGEKDAHHGGNCGNPIGVYAYSSNVVRAYREPYVTAKRVPVQERWHVRSNSIGSEHH